MRIYVSVFLLVFLGCANANNYDDIDKLTNAVILSWLDIKEAEINNNLSVSKSLCSPDDISLQSLKSCHRYVDSIYITDDVDAYMNYVNKLLNFGVKVQDLSVFDKIINAKYEETTSELYFNIAYSAYKYKRYNESLFYLKKIDDSLDDDLVYHALLIYGLIYFEKGDVDKSKKYLTRIDKQSEYYLYAQYNLGLISMRSYWWSEAEEYFNNAIRLFDETIDNKSSFVLDRLYLIKGYSQLSRKDFRSSKKSFSNVSINSSIKMRALMGVALSEIGLGNLGRSAAILKTIKSKGMVEVKLDALVTLPQVYQRAGNIKETVAYYKEAISEMDSFLKKVKNTNAELIGGYSGFYLLDFSNDWNANEVRRRKLIVKELIGYNLIGVKNTKLLYEVSSEISVIENKYIGNKLMYLSKLIKNYIKQSKYSLAVIYDQSVTIK